MCTQNFSLRAKKKFPLFVIPLLLFAVIKVTKGKKSRSNHITVVYYIKIKMEMVRFGLALARIENWSQFHKEFFV